MRDPNRIYKFTNNIATVWSKSKYTDLRFGQIVEIVFNKIKQDGKDPFYIEDDEMIEYFSKCFN